MSTSTAIATIPQTMRAGIMQLSATSVSAYNAVEERLAKEFSGDRLLEKTQLLHASALVNNVAATAGQLNSLYQYSSGSHEKIVEREIELSVAMKDLQELLEMRQQVRIATSSNMEEEY